MNCRLLYVELKTGQGDRGPAWIGHGEYSKSMRTIYFNDRAFQSCKGRGIGANYFDVESGRQYWISHIKQKGGDRHWAGGGIISVDRDAREEYLAVRELDELDPRRYQPFSLRKGDVKKRIQVLENTAVEREDYESVAPE